MRQAERSARFVIALLSALVLGPLQMPDARFLASEAQRWGIDPRVVLAIAWEETRGNVNPGVRGSHGEWGRMQLSPATARRYCPRLDIREYHANIRCFFILFRSLQTRLDLPGLLPINAIIAYNGKGQKAQAYAKRVLATIHAMETLP